MRRSMTVVLFLAIAAGVFGGCLQQNPQIKEYTNPDQAVEVAVSVQFTIVLESNPTTGYKWEPGFDTSLLKATKSDYKQSDVKAGLVGAGGKEYFTFEALKKGDTKITMTYKRSWETGSADQKIFNVSIK